MKILLFLALKLAEISAIVFIPYWIGRLSYKIPFVIEAFKGVPFWFLGNFVFLVSTIALGIIYIIVSEILPIICRANWNWAGKILQKEEK